MRDEFSRGFEERGEEPVADFEKRMLKTAFLFEQTLVSPLHDAAARGNVKALKDIIDGLMLVPEDFVVPYRFPEGRGEGLSEAAKRLFMWDHARNTALHWACGAGQIEAMNFLISQAESFGVLDLLLDARNALGDTPLHRAVWRNQEESVRILLEKGSDVQSINNDNKRPIDLVRVVSIGALLEGYDPNYYAQHADLCDEDEEEEEDPNQEILRELMANANLSDTEYSDDDDDEEEDEDEEEEEKEEEKTESVAKSGKPLTNPPELIDDDD